METPKRWEWLLCVLAVLQTIWCAQNGWTILAAWQGFVTGWFLSMCVCGQIAAPLIREQRELIDIMRDKLGLPRL